MNPLLKQYLNNLWVAFVMLVIALDCQINALLGGDPQETISSRLGKLVRQQNGAITLPFVICKLLSLIDHRHCEKAINPDEGSDQVTKR